MQDKMSTSVKKQEPSTTEGLPRQFLSSLRILFDILDENRSGYIRLQDIESRWSDDGVRGLPPGVVEGLRKVTPISGLLSFERFVSGLKLVLASRKKEPCETSGRKPFTAFKENREPFYEVDNLHFNKVSDNTNQPYFHRGVNDVHYLGKNSEPANGRSVQKGPPDGSRYGGVFERKQAYENNRNLPQAYSPTYSNNGQSQRQHSASSSAYAIRPEASIYPNRPGYSQHGPLSGGGLNHPGNPAPYPTDKVPPAIPPRQDRQRPPTFRGQEMRKSKSGPDLYSHSYSPPAIPPRERQSNNSQVLSDLKNWQQEWASNRGSMEQGRKPVHNKGPDAIYANIEQFRDKKDDQQQQYQPGQGPQKATVRRHGSGRRHTLANGIDHNMLRRMKQLEEEMSILRAGLTMTDSARDWYRKQLAVVADRQAMLGKVSYNDNSVEAYQERMNFQRARIAEVNQHLRTLIESSEKGFPLHMNLAMSNSTIRPASDDATVRALREQNRRLIDEMNQKKDYVAQIEKEKASLVKELFEARSKNQQQNYDDTTFM